MLECQRRLQTGVAKRLNASPHGMEAQGQVKHGFGHQACATLMPLSKRANSQALMKTCKQFSEIIEEQR
jgi:hypothetical protein